MNTNDMTTEKLIRDMMEKVTMFHEKMQIPINNISGFPEISRYRHLLEELEETVQAHVAGSRTGVIDGLIDLIYVAIGALLQAGAHPGISFDTVHEANMRKVPRRTERHEHDAVKPEGWEGPDHEAVLGQMEILRQVSPVWVDLTKLRIHKGNNYNRGSVTRDMHFPLGDKSFFQVIWMKMCRIRSLTEAPGDTPEQQAESRRLVERELNDVQVYACFWAEYMKGIAL